MRAKTRKILLVLAMVLLAMNGAGFLPESLQGFLPPGAAAGRGLIGMSAAVIWALLAIGLLATLVVVPLCIWTGLEIKPSRVGPGPEAAVEAHGPGGAASLLAGVLPLLGLAGTVLGLIASFSGASEGMSGAEAVKAGIATALQTTLFGLAGAIPAVFGGWFVDSRVEKVRLRAKAFNRRSGREASLAPGSGPAENRGRSAIRSRGPVVGGPGNYALEEDLIALLHEVKR